MKKDFLTLVLSFLLICFHANAQTSWTTGTSSITSKPTTAKVGIGVTSPIAKLDVSYTYSSSSAAYYGINNEYINMDATSANHSTGMNTYVESQNQGITDGHVIYVRNDHRTSTKDVYGVDIYAVAYARPTTTVYGVRAEVSGGSKRWAGYFTGGDMYVSGNVGIGTTTPTQKLDVNGTIKGNALSVVSGLTSYSTSNLNLQTNSTTRMTILNSNGNVGIGTTTPTQKLDVNGTIKANTLSVVSGLSSYSTSNLYLQTNGTNRITVLNTNGNVGIGTTAPRNALDVNGVIRAKEVRIEATPWPDYVFSEDYQLPTLNEVKSHIEEKQHLPGIPSAKEVAEDGINLSEMNAKLLQKIEELTLYMIQQQELNEKQQKLIEDLEKKVATTSK